jgi:hypothetical protein
MVFEESAEVDMLELLREPDGGVERVQRRVRLWFECGPD